MGGASKPQKELGFFFYSFVFICQSLLLCRSFFVLVNSPLLTAVSVQCIMGNDRSLGKGMCLSTTHIRVCVCVCVTVYVCVNVCVVYSVSSWLHAAGGGASSSSVVPCCIVVNVVFLAGVHGLHVGRTGVPLDGVKYCGQLLIG